ncbi:MAG: type II toxin-antitoxin system prevent-host-death family antitoxin [Symbiobacteriaceae bacterium]|nr:type II toxin-antitoxin system prevent-host-death family antitoxin [Symbiobacteriaceae bacterium]
MQQVNIHAAKTHLSALLEKAAAGESFIIAKAGKPLVTVRPYDPDNSTSRVGFLKGLIKVPVDFDHLGQEEITVMFEGAVIKP